MIKKILSATVLLIPLCAQAACEQEVLEFCNASNRGYIGTPGYRNCISQEQSYVNNGTAGSEYNNPNVDASQRPYLFKIFQCTQSTLRRPTDSPVKEKKEDECKAKPSFDSKVEVEQVGDSLPYCWAKMKNTSAFPITCDVTNDRGQQIRRWTIYPGRDTGYGWPLLASNEQCHANFNCERTKDLSTNKPARYGKCD